MIAAEPIAQEPQTLIDKVLRYDPTADVEQIRRAYEIARAAHAGQSRDSGASYIDHPLAVAGILADLQMDTAAIVAALLHDVVEDTGIELPAIQGKFGQEIARLVDGVTKLSQAEFEQKELDPDEIAD